MLHGPASGEPAAGQEKLTRVLALIAYMHSFPPSHDPKSHTQLNMGATRQRRPRPSSFILLTLLAATTTTSTTAASSPSSASAAKRPSTRLRHQPQPQTPPLPPSHTVTLAPCAPLPVLSNCSAVPQAFHDNVEACAHISFSAFGQKATTAHLSFVLMGEEEEGGDTTVPKLEAVREDAACEKQIEKQDSDSSTSSTSSSSSSSNDGERRALKAVSLNFAGTTKEGEDLDRKSIKTKSDNAVVQDSDSDSEISGTTLTMVLLVGSVFYFPTQAEVYEFMQPKVAAAMREKGLYDPTQEGPCVPSGNDDNNKNTSSSNSYPAHPAFSELKEENDYVTSIGRRQRRSLLQDNDNDDDNTTDGGSSNCADVVQAFNSEGGGDEATYAHLYTCNITASTPDGPSPVVHRLAFDGLLPEDFPYTYWVFLNINPAASSSSSFSLASFSVNQTIRYEAAFSPPFIPSSSKVIEPLFAILLLVALLYFVLFCRYVSNPALDWLSTTRWGKRCLTGGERC